MVWKSSAIFKWEMYTINNNVVLQDDNDGDVVLRQMKRRNISDIPLLHTMEDELWDDKLLGKAASRTGGKEVQQPPP